MTENVWCAVNTLSLCPLSTLCLSFYPSPLSLYISLSPVSHTVCYCITVTYILLKKIKACLFLLHAWKCSVETINIGGEGGGGNIKMMTMTLRWKLTLPANICMRNVFLPFPFVPFGFWDLENFSPQRLSVLLSVLTVYSVCRFVSPGVHTSHFLLVFWFWGLKFWCCSFIHFCFFLFSPPPRHIQRHHFPPCFAIPLLSNTKL